MAEALGTEDGGPGEVAGLLSALFGGMGDGTRIDRPDPADAVTVRQDGLRIVRGLTPAERDDLLACWIELWRGVVNSTAPSWRWRPPSVPTASHGRSPGSREGRRGRRDQRFTLPLISGTPNSS